MKHEFEPQQLATDGSEKSSISGGEYIPIVSCRQFIWYDSVDQNIASFISEEKYIVLTLRR